MFNFFKNYLRGIQVFNKLVAEPAEPTTFLYGDEGTIHRTKYLHVETYKGHVTAVWFRCMRLPFEQVTVSEPRAVEMTEAGIQSPAPALVAVKLER